MQQRHTISLPFPHSGLHAHNKGHWRDKKTDIKNARHMAYITAIELVSSWGILTRPVSVVYVFLMPNELGRDIANLVQSCKPYIDGIVDSGLLPDDNWRTITSIEATASVDEHTPRVIITLTTVD